MGILNVTPDSFSDGGRFVDRDVAREAAERMGGEGAAIIDIGGESTRPGALEIGEAEELDRVVPVVEAICKTVDVPVSVDTSKPAVMRESVAAGASMINDVFALQCDGALQAAVDLAVPICLMHMRGRPRTMQNNPEFRDVTTDVTAFLQERAEIAIAAGVARDCIVIDPGFGFGKSHAHNIELLANLRHLMSLNFPILVGLSRKSTLGAITGREVDDRMAGSIAAAAIAVLQGASIVRAHDVKETVDALNVVGALMEVNQ